MDGNGGGKARRVLVIDDDDEVRDALAELLESEGFQVEKASNGREGLELLRHEPPPAVIVLDLLMPEMDGWQFCEEQASDPSIRGIPVLIVSATVEPRRFPRSVNDGAFFRKPADLLRLISTIEGYCTCPV